MRDDAHKCKIRQQQSGLKLNVMRAKYMESDAQTDILMNVDGLLQKVKT